MSAKHANNWDNRYDEERYFYGESPNEFVASQLPQLEKGRGLFLAEGEGRNVVFAAGLGHEVVAVDSSAVGRDKALALAEKMGVSIEYRLEDVIGSGWEDETWDFVVLCFAHLPPELLPRMHAGVVRCLRPGGTVILQSFSRQQFGRSSGGPPRLEWLHEVGELKKDFSGIGWSRLLEREVELRESVGHHGLAMVIEGVGKREV